MRLYFTLLFLFPETQDGRAATVWNFVGDGDQEEKGM